MARYIRLLAVAAVLLSLSASVEAGGGKKRGKNSQAGDAAGWLAAGKHISFVLSGNGKQNLLLSTDRDAVATAPQKAFRISKQEADAFVRVIVDCGLWNRWLTEAPGGPIAGRILSIGNGDPRGSKMWVLGDRSDDLSSMFIFRHLLETFKGERRQAVKDWLEQGLDEEDR